MAIHDIDRHTPITRARSVGSNILSDSSCRLAYKPEWI